MCYLQSVLRISILCLSVLVVLLLPASAGAQDRSLEISELAAYSLQDGPETRSDSFDYLLADELGLYAGIVVSGLEDDRREKLDLFLVVFGEDDQDRKHPLLKQKRSESFGNGEFAIEFTDFMDADAWFGDSEFTVVLEASLRGAQSVRREYELSIEGPRMPDVSFDEVSVYSWERGPGYDDLQPGEEFVIDITITVEDNETGLDPRLRLFATMEDDLWYIDPEDAFMPPAPNWSEAWLRGESGQWQVWARGRMPSYFERPFDYYHDYRVYAFVGFGENPQRHSHYIGMTLIDPDNGELRESANILERLVDLTAAGHWNIRHTKRPQAD